MSNKTKQIILYSLPAIIFIVLSFSLQMLFYNSLDKQTEICRTAASRSEGNLSSVCQTIAGVATSVFSTIIQLMTVVIMLLAGLLLSLKLKVFELEGQIEELKEKINV
jgi:hypothetical protein